MNLEVLNRKGDTPLHRAAAKGHANLVEFLVAVGADIEAKNHAGWTALHWATFMEREKVVRRLLRDGAIPSIRDRMGKTPADIVEEMKVLISTGEVVEIERLLCEAMERKGGGRVRSLKRLCVRRLVGRQQHGELVEYLRLVYGGDDLEPDSDSNAAEADGESKEPDDPQ